MGERIDRRDVLKTTAGALAAGLMAPLVAGAADAPPQGRPKRPLKKAYFGLPKGGSSLVDQFKILKDAGFDGLQLNMPAKELPVGKVQEALRESGLQRIIAATYRLLGTMSFLTAGDTEVRAWTIPINSTAVKAAGAIHSDFEKKFIRAEVVNWKNLIDLGGYPGVREKGLLRLEGKEYIVKDGDVLVIRHS